MREPVNAGLCRSSQRTVRYQNRPCSRSAVRPSVVHRTSWSEFLSECGTNKDAASRRLLLMSLKRHEEIYPNDRGADQKADAPAHRLDEFPAGYSLTGCSPALPASASPARVDYAFSSAQLRGFSVTREVDKPKQHDSGGSTLMDQFFCPKNRVHLRFRSHAVR